MLMIGKMHVSPEYLKHELKANRNDGKKFWQNNRKILPDISETPNIRLNDSLGEKSNYIAARRKL